MSKSEDPVEGQTQKHAPLPAWGSVHLGAASYIHGHHQGDGGWCCQRTSPAPSKVCCLSLFFALSHTYTHASSLPSSVAPCQHIALPLGISHSLAWLTLYSPGPIRSFRFHSCLPFRHKTCRYCIFHSLLGCCFAFLIIQDTFK